MAYQQKYYYTFYSIDNKLNRVELWQDTSTTLTAEQVDSMGMPFSVEMTDLESKFTSVRGTGCEINLLSYSDMKFFTGLYHVDKKEFIVKHYIDGSINWLGYLNSEMMRETYSLATNYPVQVTGNDGFALLERIQFLQTNGSYYTGVKSLFEILTICIDRIELPFTAINIALATTSPTLSIGSNNTLLNLTYIDTANFYKEDGTAETMRKVLESILEPHGAFIVQKNGALWITDIHSMAGAASLSFKSFTGSTWTYSSTISYNPLVTISDVGYMGTDTEIEISGGKNKQVVNYSPYPIKFVVPQTLVDISEFTGAVPVFYTTGTDRMYKVLTGHDKLTAYSPAKFEQSYRHTGISIEPEIESEASICLKWDAGTVWTKIAELTVNPFVAITKGSTAWEPNPAIKSMRGVAFKISGEVQFWRYWSGKDGGVRTCYLKAVLRVGTKYSWMQEIRPGWEDYPGTPQKYNTLNIHKDDNSDISGQWLSIIGLFSSDVFCTNDIDLSGDVYLDIYSDIIYIDTNGKTWTNTNVHNASVRLRNLALTIVDATTRKDVGGTDIEYTAYLDPLQKEEADKIELICGTDITYADRAKIMYLDTVYKALKLWTRAGQTNCIETLLLNSLSSNYRAGYYTLNNMKLANSFGPLNVFTDTYTGSKVFMVKQMTINYRDNTIECTLVEISEDQLTITPI